LAQVTSSTSSQFVFLPLLFRFPALLVAAGIDLIDVREETGNRGSQFGSLFFLRDNPLLRIMT
jgi:hypothetical protein